MRLMFATAEPCPTFRPDVAALFGKFLPRLGVATDVVAERARDVADEVCWGGGEALLVSGGSARPGRYLASLAHCARSFSRADRDRYHALQVRDMPLVALIGLAIARLKGLPFFYWMSFPSPEGQIALARRRGLSAGMAAFLIRLLWRGWVYRFVLYRIVLRRADHVFVQSERMRGDLVAKGIPRAKLTPVVMGVDLERCAPERIAGAPDPRLEGRRVLVYLGNLGGDRRIDILLDMVRLVRRRFPQALLVLVGEADDEGEGRWLRERAREAGVADATLFTGWLSAEEGWRYARRAEVGLSPIPRGSLLDCGSPTKVVEYLALGVPVVANDNPDQERVLREGGGGLCVPLSAEDFAAAVCRLLADPSRARAMAASGQAYVRARRGYDTLAVELADKYAELLRIAPREGRCAA